MRLLTEPLAAAIALITKIYSPQTLNVALLRQFRSCGSNNSILSGNYQYLRGFLCCFEATKGNKKAPDHGVIGGCLTTACKWDLRAKSP
jgi:hypothetical protein